MLQLELLEDRLTPSTHTWTGAQSALWSDDRNWNGNAPYGDASAALVFGGAQRLDTIHDLPDRMTIESITFEAGGYTLSDGPDAYDIALKGDIVSHANGGTNTISLALNWEVSGIHELQIEGSDTVVMNGILVGITTFTGLNTDIRKVGSGTLVMSGDHSFLLNYLDVAAGTLQLGSDHGLGDNERIVVRPGAVLDLNNHDASLTPLDFFGKAGEIRLGNANLTLKDHQLTHIFGDISGTGGLTVSEDANVWLDGTVTYTGPTRLLSGKLEIDGSSARSPITISAGAGLYGGGTTGALSVSGLVEPGYGLFQQGGVLQSNGDATFLSGSSFAALLNGPTPGAIGYNQLNVKGKVDLRGSPQLNISGRDTPLPGDTFTILTSTEGISGTFLGLPDGTKFDLNGAPMRINYTANSVVLSRPQFLPAVTYSAGDDPRFVAVGDFRGDGHKDLVVVSPYSESVAVLLNHFDGTFQAAVNYATYGNPTSVTVGDFNGDGKLDLVTVSYAAEVPTLSVLLGNGDGTFQAAVTYPLDRQAWAVAAGHFRGNSVLDLVTANLYEDSVSVLLGNGDGTFQPAVTYAVGQRPQSVAVRDLGNGTLDIVTGNYGTVSVLLGNGDGTFQPAMTFPGASTDSGFLTSIAVGDLRGNGVLDLVTTVANDNHVYVLLGNGDGTFAAPRSVYVGDQPGHVAVGDFNGDGNLDFVATTGYPGNRGLALVYGQGDGTFGAPSYYYLMPGLSSLAVDSFRFNPDPAVIPFPDVAVINANVVSVLLNAGVVIPAPGPPGGHRRPSPVAALFAGDGFSRIAGADAALKAWSSPPEIPASATPSPRALTPSLKVAGLERFFAAAIEQDRGFAWSRSKQETLLSAGDWWVDEVGKGGALIDRPFPATHSEYPA